jgi:nucleoside-diphosphate-sugar epimerase
MKIVVIGGTGHIGSYLVPRLVLAGHTVIVVNRGEQKPYRDPGIWRYVECQRVERNQEEAAGTFGARIAAMSADVVIDLICFTLRSAQHLVHGLAGRTGHFLLCGTIWVHGHSQAVPTTESMSRKPFGEYGIRKAAIEEWLLSTARDEGFPATILHPGHIVGPGWVPLNPAGNFNPAVFTTLAAGEKLTIPNLGLETVHHVHADDVAQAFCRAIENRSVSLGESFHAVSSGALTLRGYAEQVSRWFGREPILEFQHWEQWKKGVSAADAEATWDHIAHSPHCSIEKARRLLNYAPRYGSLEAVFESLEALGLRGSSSSSASLSR